MCFDGGEAVLNRVERWRIWWEVQATHPAKKNSVCSSQTKLAVYTPIFDHLTDNGFLVNLAIIHYYDRVWMGIRLHAIEKTVYEPNETFRVERSFNDVNTEYAI